MKKKILSLLLVICFIVPCLFLLTACGGELQTGVEYHLDKVEFNWTSEAEKQAILNGQTEAEALSFYKTIESYILFKNDGSVESVSYPKDTQPTEDSVRVFYYTVQEKTISIYATAEKEGNPSFTLTIDGDSIVQETILGTGEQTSTLIMTYKK